MKHKLTLEDLSPTEATFQLDEYKDKVFTLRKVSMMDRKLWSAKYGGDKEVQKIFLEGANDKMLELAYHQLKDKDCFPTVEDFLSKIYSATETSNVIRALTVTMGISQPIIDKMIQEEIEAKEKEDPKP